MGDAIPAILMSRCMAERLQAMTTEGFPSAAASSETAAAMAALALFLAYMCHGSGGPVPDPSSCVIHLCNLLVK